MIIVSLRTEVLLIVRAIERCLFPVERCKYIFFFICNFFYHFLKYIRETQLNYKYKLNIHNYKSSYCNYNYMKISTLLVL